MSKIGFIGCGNMGGTLAKAAAKSENEIYLADYSFEKAEDLAKQIGAKALYNVDIAAGCDLIFLGVKPQVLSSVLADLKHILSVRHQNFCLVSMAAGVTIESLKEMAGGDYPIIRIMPNTPAAVENGMILYCQSENVTNEQVQLFLNSMASAGTLDSIDETLIDAGCAVSGCGPAFVYMFIDALADGGVKCGLLREQALIYAAETVLGAAKMVKESGISPEELKNAVCSPNGSTIEGVKVLESLNLKDTCISAVLASFKRTKELGQK